MQGAKITGTDWTDVVLRKDQQVRGVDCWNNSAHCVGAVGGPNVNLSFRAALICGTWRGGVVVGMKFRRAYCMEGLSLSQGGCGRKETVCMVAAAVQK